MKTGSALTLIVILFVFVTTLNSQESEKSKLLQLHQKALEAHMKSDIRLLLEDEVEDYAVVSNGGVSHPTKKDREAFLGPYLRSTRFETYKDLIPPIVQVSEDGKLGWLIAQISAKGSQKKADGSEANIEFVCAWIELYEKREGKWYRVGNVSNFKPSKSLAKTPSRKAKEIQHG